MLYVTVKSLAIINTVNKHRLQVHILIELLQYFVLCLRQMKWIQAGLDFWLEEKEVSQLQFETHKTGKCVKHNIKNIYNKVKRNANT